MADNPEKLVLLEYTDTYLNHHRHSQAAYEHVMEVLNRFDFMVDLARERAVRELQVPISNVVALQIPTARPHTEQLPPQHIATVTPLPLRTPTLPSA